MLFLFGYHFEHCFVRLFMLCMCDDVRQINVLCHTTKKCRHRYSLTQQLTTHSQHTTNVAINTTMQNTKIQNANTECKNKKQIVENRKNKIIRRKHNALTTPGNTQAQHT